MRSAQINSCRTTFTLSRPRSPKTSRVSRFTTKAAEQQRADPWQDKYPSWDSIYNELNTKYSLRSVSVDEAAIMMDQGKALLVDIRLEEDYKESHPKNAVSCPAFRIIKPQDGFSVGRLMKGLLMASNGVTPTEMAPQFPSEAAKLAANGMCLILACEAGGSPTATTSFPTGKASRSLKSAWKLMHSGAVAPEQVLHLSGGVLAWYNAGLPMEGELEYNPARAGRTPNAVGAARDVANEK